jgi:hypothetical protein
MRKSMTDLKEEMRAVARGETRASPLPVANPCPQPCREKR